MAPWPSIGRPCARRRAGRKAAALQRRGDVRGARCGRRGWPGSRGCAGRDPPRGPRSPMSPMSTSHPASHDGTGPRWAPRHVVIVGGGFGGLSLARALGGSEIQVTLVDRRNFHLFQPLLYQVATGILAAADVAHPLRHVLRRHRNIDVVLGEVMEIDVSGRSVVLADGGRIGYDELVLAPGAEQHWFGHASWSRLAP